jgi:sporulation protein YlmC with PRC-barrel domain
MQFRPNARVYTLDGKNVGRVDRVVLDSRTRDVIHLVVRKGFLFSEAKVVPMGLIVAATDKGVTLWGDVSDFETLPLFEDTPALQASDCLLPTEPVAVPPLYFYPPSGGAPSIAVADAPTLSVVETSQSIPEGTVALKEGAKVIAHDGKCIGTVEQILVDPHLDRATDLVIAQGLLVKEKRRVPVTWMSEVKEDEVHLAVASQAIDELGFIPD